MLNLPVVYSTDRSKAVVPVLVLLFVALWFILRGDLFYVLNCVILFLCFSVLLALRLPRLGKRELILVLFVRLFDLCLFGFVGFVVFFVKIDEKSTLTVLADSKYNILIFFAVKNVSSYLHFFSKKNQHIYVSIDLNFNDSLTNDIVSFEQLGPELLNQLDRRETAAEFYMGCAKQKVKLQPNSIWAASNKKCLQT